MFPTRIPCRAIKPVGEKILGARTRQHIQLENLPRTALPSDIERVLRRERLVGVENVQLQLFRFLPTGKAYIRLSHPDFLQMNLTKLGNVTIGGHIIAASSCTEPPTIGNLRGVKGRKTALEQGSFSGLTSSGSMSNGRQVCAWGFPPKSSVECVKDFLERNKIYILGDNPEIHQIHLRQPDEFSLYSRYLIRTPCISDSYYIVRRVHQMLFKPDKFGTKFLVRAYVVR